MLDAHRRDTREGVKDSFLCSALDLPKEGQSASLGVSRVYGQGRYQPANVQLACVCLLTAPRTRLKETERGTRFACPAFLRADAPRRESGVRDGSRAPSPSARPRLPVCAVPLMRSVGRAQSPQTECPNTSQEASFSTSMGAVGRRGRGLARGSKYFLNITAF